MTREEKIYKLADIIAPLVPSLRGCDCTVIAKKLIDLGWEEKSETALAVLTALCEPMDVWTETDDPEQSRQRKIGGLLFVEKSNERIAKIAKSYGVEIKNNP